MTGSRALLAVPVVVAVFGLAGCRGAERAAPPVVSADPLAGVEATVDGIEHDVDTDAGSDARTGR
jgi:hypothetical protein